MGNLKLKIFRVKQGIFTLYVWKMTASKLIELSYSDVRKVEKWENQDFLWLNIKWIQRRLKNDKVKAIKDYLTSFDATFPNGIIMNIKPENIIENNFNEDYIVIDDKPSVFNIIDWQHRLAWLNNTEIANDFEVIITFFIDLNYSEEANIFSIINSQQTKVDASLKYSLELDSSIYTPRKFISLIWLAFFENEDSPWYNLIKIWILSDDEDDNDGILSFSSFCRYIESITYNVKDYYHIRNILHSDNSIEMDYDLNKYILWDYYIKNDISSALLVLLNFFISFKKHFEKDWWNNKSILNKTTWYSAMVKLLVDIYNDGKIKWIEKYDGTFFDKYISRLKDMDWTINTEKYKWSWESSTNELYKVFHDKIFIKKELD